MNDIGTILLTSEITTSNCTKNKFNLSEENIEIIFNPYKPYKVILDNDEK